MSSEANQNFTLEDLVDSLPESSSQNIAVVDLKPFYDNPTGNEVVKFREPTVEDIYASAKDALEILKIEDYVFWSREQAIVTALLGLCHVHPPVKNPPTLAYCKMALKNPGAFLALQNKFYGTFPWLKNLAAAVEEKKTGLKDPLKSLSSSPPSGILTDRQKKSRVSKQVPS